MSSPVFKEALLDTDDSVISISALDGRLYVLTSFGRILQAQPDWTWIEMPAPKIESFTETPHGS
jgi:hypothetical protein